MQIKICGLTSPKEADYVNAVQADYIGMILFFEKSKRNITISQATPIMQALRPQIKKVAVVVSPTLEQVKQIEAAGFDYIQIHGELKTEIIQKKQSTIGRAMVGGILFGGPGAIVGAISAGKKEKKKTNLYFIISYTSSSGEEKYINFEVSGGGFNGRKLADKLRELCNIKDIKREDEIKL